MILGLIWCACITFSYVSTRNVQDTGLAVIMLNDTPLMNQDMKPGKSQSLLPEGVTVKILSSKGNYLEIQVPDGRTGWVDAANLTKV
jgi:hypothetical protein